MSPKSINYDESISFSISYNLKGIYRHFQMHVKIEALCEKLLEQHPGKKSGAHVAPDVSPRSIGNHLFEAGLRSYVPLARLSFTHDTAKHGYSGVMKMLTGEWNGALLSSVMRVDSVCM